MFPVLYSRSLLVINSQVFGCLDFLFVCLFEATSDAVYLKEDLARVKRSSLEIKIKKSAFAYHV